MNKTEIESLDTLLTLDEGSTSYRGSEIPENLVDTEYINEEIRHPTRCQFLDGCQAHCISERQGDQLLVECDEGHEATVPVSEHRFHDIDFRAILEAVADILEQPLTEFDQESRPRYVSGATDDGLNIFLVISPSDYEKTINEICMQTLAEDTPALLITPQESVKDLLEIKSLFSSSNLIYTVPFTMLAEQDLIQSSLDTITNIQDIEQKVLQDLEGDRSLVHRVNSNPRYILTELNHMRLLRLAKELPQYSGTRLEKIVETAFSHLFVTYPESGGEDDRGGNVPDNLFYISDSGLPEDYGTVLGVADSKSGSDAGFGSEKIEGKHDEYLEMARRQSVPADKIAHTFLVLGFDGQKEIDFYDEMSEIYREDEFLVIMTAEALALILAAYLAHTVSNDLKLVRGNFQTVIYPFFDKESFREAGLAGIVREVGKSRKEYAEKYKQREDLMIITQDVVKERIRQCMESPNDVVVLTLASIPPDSEGLEPRFCCRRLHVAECI